MFRLVERSYHQLLTRPTLTQTSLASLVVELQKRRCCPGCLLRVLNCHEPAAYLANSKDILTCISKLLNIPLDTLIDNSIKESDPCNTCLGFLQNEAAKTIAQGILAAIKQQGYDHDSCQTNVSLPIGSMIRDKLLWVLVRSLTTGFPPEEHLPNLRHILRVTIGKTLECLSSLKYDKDSKLSVVFHLSHEETAKDHTFLNGSTVSDHNLKWKATGNSRSKVTDNLQGLNDSAIKNLDLLPWSFITSFGSLEKVEMSQESIFLAGRYLKLERGVSQTPWAVNGRLLAENSVSDLIGLPCQRLFNCSSVSFCSSGREDADVRMLGTGRPFSLELVNPKRTRFESISKELAQLTHLINSNLPCLVKTTKLTLIDRAGLELLKEGEESKVKFYRALVWVVDPIPNQDYIDQKLSASLPAFPFQVSQLTPLRVLHRRSPLIREKTIHHLKVDWIHPHYLVMEIKAEAGTYIKEFVHGDVNRTTPNLSQFLGQPAADILELDVIHIDLEWPPPKYLSV